MVSFISAGRYQLAIVPVSIIYNLSVVWVKKFKSCEAIIQRFFPEDVYLMIALCNIVSVSYTHLTLPTIYSV